MTSKVLILDDDRDFNQLLTSVFVQGGYNAVSLIDAGEALRQAITREYQLIVVDHMMPGITGVEFVSNLREANLDTPVIIVSGILSDETIRSYIKLGVGGIFRKPLNIFNLLRKAGELVHKRTGELPDAQLAKKLSKSRSQLPFTFRSFPCISPAAAQFAHDLYNHRSFSKRLLLTGPPGTHFEAICDDLRNFRAMGREELVVLSSRGDAADDNLLARIEHQHRKGTEALMLLIPDICRISEKDAENLQLALDRKPPFNKLPINLRVVFCSRQPPSELYNQSLISREVYEITACEEVQVPALASAPEDIPLMAEAILASIAIASGKQRAQITEDVHRYLMNRPWRQNFKELDRVIRDAQRLAGNSILIPLEDIIAADQYGCHRPRRVLQHSLKQHLEIARADYVETILTYHKQNLNAAADTLGIPTEFLHKILNH